MQWYRRIRMGRKLLLPGQESDFYQDSMEEIYRAMVAQNRRAYTGVEKVDQFIRKQYGYKLSIDEELYLLIHIKRILDEQQG